MIMNAIMITQQSIMLLRYNNGTIYANKMENNGNGSGNIDNETYMIKLCMAKENFSISIF